MGQDSEEKTELQLAVETAAKAEGKSVEEWINGVVESAARKTLQDAADHPEPAPEA